ncbi:MAG: hypothetical protein HDS45_04785 [Bacteroides sp.]|nr:hypothetical protein [Bacteroides sp.]
MPYLDGCRYGKRTYEYLKLHLVPELTRADKQRNKETLNLASLLETDSFPSSAYSNRHRLPSSGSEV